MPKSIRLLAATLVTALAATAAHAGFVYSSQGVDFTFESVDSNTFTLRVQNALDATGNWGPATHLGYLGVKSIGNLGGLTGVNVSVSPTPSSAITWSYTLGEMNNNGCNGQSQSGGLCLEASGLALSNDLLFTVDLLGTGFDLTTVTAPHLKTGFTVWTPAKGKKEAGYSVVGDLLSKDLVAAPVQQNDAPPPLTNVPQSNSVPEPASWALAGLALAGAWLARRRRA